MAKKRKRSPPLSYEEKYRQIKDSKFDVDIERPVTSSQKAMVTRYHRLLFGGKSSSGTYNRGLARTYKPTTSKHKDTIRAIYGIKGARRIKNGYYPKQLGNLKSVSGDFITFQSNIGKIKVANVSKKMMALGSRKERREALSGLQGKNVQLMIGQSIQTISFDDIDDVLDAIEDIDEHYGDQATAGVTAIVIG